jgi:ribosomal protein S27AE
MEKTHIHHILPKHMGGTDEPENLIELTVEEHAEAHRILYEEHGHWQDYCAWQGLSGQISIQDAIKFAQQNASKDWMKTEAGKKKLRDGWIKRKEKGLGTAWNKGKTKENHEGLKKLSEHNKKMRSEGRLSNIGDLMRGKSLDDNHKEKLSKAAKNRPKKTCPHCGKSVIIQMFNRWHGEKCKKASKNT